MVGVENFDLRRISPHFVSVSQHFVNREIAKFPISIRFRSISRKIRKRKNIFFATFHGETTYFSIQFRGEIYSFSPYFTKIYFANANLSEFNQFHSEIEVKLRRNIPISQRN